MKFFSAKNMITFVALAIVIYAALIIWSGYSQVSVELAKLNLLIIPVVMFLTIIDDLFRFFKWEYFLRRLKIRIPFKTSFLIFFSGISMAITPAKVGEVLKSYLLKEKRGIKMRRSLMVVVIERLTDVLALGILALIGSFAFIQSPYFQAVTVLLIGAVIFAFLLLTNRKVFKLSSKTLLKIPVVKNYVRGIDQLYESSHVLIGVKSLLITTAISVAAWFYECFALYLVLQAIGYPLPLQVCIFIFAFSSVFGSATVLPGGLGAAEGSFIALLMLQKIPFAPATLVTVIIRLLTLFWGVSMGMVALFFAMRLKSKL